jgi:hypothetical protein
VCASVRLAFDGLLCSYCPGHGSDPGGLSGCVGTVGQLKTGR